MLFVYHLFLIAGLIFLIPISSFSSTNIISSASSELTVSQLGKMPMAFTENQGQWDEKIKFRADAGGATMWFTGVGAYYQFTRSVSKDEPLGPVDPMYEQLDREPEQYETMMIKASFVGANPDPQMVGDEIMEYKCNYFIGNESDKWRTDVPNYQAVIYEQVYDGIDLKYYGNGKQMEYDFIVSPGADYSQIKIEYEGTKSVSVNVDGELVVETEWGEVVEQKPIVYQIEDERRIPVDGIYSLQGNNSFGFKINNYNPSLPLIIDPVLSYSTYFGGGNYDEGYDITVDDSGCAYITGLTSSIDVPTALEYQIHQGIEDVFVTKFNNDGNTLVYSTYIGGSDDDYGKGIAVDDSGNAYITGQTNSTDFPVEGYYQSDNGGIDLFVLKLNSSGDSLVYSTYLGGSNTDIGNDVTIDNTGSAYVTGFTWSSDFPTAGDYRPYQGDYDVIITKLNSTGDDLIYSTYLGGSAHDWGDGIAIDELGNAYVTGNSASSNFPTVGAYQSHQGGHDAFVTKLNSSGSTLLYSTYVGGTAGDVGNSIAVDEYGQAHIIGRKQLHLYYHQA